MDDKIKFEFHDGWIFLSLAIHKTATTEGVTLKEMISSADMINHAIPTVHEINDFMNKFLKIGAIQIKDKKFIINSTIFNQYKALLKKTKNNLKLIDLITDHFNKSDFNINCHEEYCINEKTMNKACGEYKKEFWEIYNK
ncbi:MAG: hypothetical protein GY754_23705 [bacterium]|nr:hypothetical protein [bacterium]